MKQQLTIAMEMLAERPDTLFIGQSVDCPGTSMYATLEGVPNSKKIEFPVEETLQLGASIGLSLEGFVPVSIFPRFNFLICATDMLVNHLDRINEFSLYKPKVIVRTAVGSSKPLDPGPQHQDDFTEAFRIMLRNTNVLRLKSPEHVVPAYRAASDSKVPSLLIEG